MNNKNAVVFKGSERGILIIIDEKAQYDEIKKLLSEKAEKAKEFFKGGAASVTFKGRALTEDEEKELLNIVSEKSGLNVSFEVTSTIEEASEKAEETKKTEANEDKKQAGENIKENIKESAKEEKAMDKKLTNLIVETKNITEYHMGSLRSGQSISYKGSVVIVGDVNPGAEVKAEGNVIVLGKLKGAVHAGSMGDRTAFVASLYMKPTQLIIADVMTSFPDDSGRKIVPEYAYISDDKIYVEVL